MGCTSSKEFERVSKKDGWEAPVTRSQSMPVTTASKYPARDDSFHVVALTSSTYGFLKVEGADADQDTPSLKDKTEVDAVSEMYQKFRDLDIPEVMEPKPWSEMSFDLPQLNLELKAKSPMPAGGLSSEPETINMWELMDGLDDELSPYPRGSVSASPLMLRQSEKANSAFAVRTVEELDAAVASTVVVSTDSSKAPVGAQAGKLTKSTSLVVQGSGKENAKPNSLSSLMAQRSASNSPLGAVKSATVAVSGNPSTKGTAPPLLQIPSTVVKPANSTSTAIVAVGSPVRGPSEVTSSATVCTPKQSSISGPSLTPVRPATAGRNGGSSSKVPSAEIPPLTLESGFEHVPVPLSSAPTLDKKASSRGVSPKIAGRIPPLSLDAVDKRLSLPQSAAGSGLQVYAGVKVSPRLAERLAAFSASSPTVQVDSSPRAITGKPEERSSSGKQVSPRNFVADNPSQRQNSLDGPEVTYVNNYPSSPDDSDDPLFDPELLASFEKAFEQISEDDWYAVRTGGETTSSGSTTDVESPVNRGGRDGALIQDKFSGTEVPAKGNKISQALPEFVQQQVSSRAPGEVKHLKKVSSSKVSPLEIDEKVVEFKVREDPLDKFEKKCPPGGEERVVLYVTSLRGIRKTFEDCNNLRMILQSFSVVVDERDVAMHSEFRQELKDLMGKPVPVPRVFIKGRYVGGHDEVAQLHDDGVLALLVEGLPSEKSRGPCDGCGGVRFVPCMECSGSCKVLTEEDEVVRCPDCNENGLMRCPICY